MSFDRLTLLFDKLFGFHTKSIAVTTGREWTHSLFTPDPPHYLLWVRFSNSENTDLLVEFFRDRKVENDGRKSTKPQSIGVTIT